MPDRTRCWQCLYMASWSTLCSGVSSYKVMTGVQTPAGRGFILGSDVREPVLIVKVDR